jgi:hypothetical protein
LPYQSDNGKAWTTPEEFGGTNHSAVQSAVNTGKNVYFGYKEYVFGAQVVVGTDDSQIFEGNGTIKLADGEPINTRLFNVFQANNIVFDGLTFDGNKANQTQPPADNSWDDAASRIYYTSITANATVGLAIKNCELKNCCTCSINLIACTDVIIKNNYFHDAYMDALYSSSGLNTNVAFSKNVVRDITYRDGIGDIIFRYGNGVIVNGTNVRITDNTIIRTDRSGMKPSTSQLASDYQILRNNLLDNDWQGVHPNEGSAFVIEDNIVDGAGENGMLFGYDDNPNPVSGVDIRRNTITNSGTRDTGTAPSAQNGIMLTGATTDVDIENNTIDTAGAYGILSVYSNNVRTLGNTITRAVTRPVYIDGDGLPASTKRSYDWTMDSDKLYCNDVAIDGIKVGDYSYNLTFQNVEVYDATVVGLFLQEPDNVLAKDCVIQNSGSYGIRLVAVTNSTLDGCQVDNTGLDAIVFLPITAQNSDTVTVKNNDIDTARDGVRLYNTPTNIDIQANNTYANLTGSPVNWI